MKVFRLLAILSLIPLLLNSCKDDEPQYLGEFRLGAEGESYIKFEPGSYWVYENDKTGERDSVVMDYYYSEMRHFKGVEREYYREHIAFKWRINESGSYTHITGHPFVDLTPNSTWEETVRRWSFISSPEASSSSTMIWVPVSFETGGGVSGQLTRRTIIHDSLLVAGEWYHDVAVFEVDNDWIWNTFNTNHTKYYWAKNVGLIRRVLLEENSIVELESFNLIKYQVTQ